MYRTLRETIRDTMTVDDAKVQPASSGGKKDFNSAKRNESQFCKLLYDWTSSKSSISFASNGEVKFVTVMCRKGINLNLKSCHREGKYLEIVRLVYF